MSPRLKAAFAAEMQQAKDYFRVGNFDSVFAHLERAHILGQRDTLRHTWSHWWMLRVGWHRQDFREVWGQVLRMTASLLFSRIWVPEGNTGGANVSPVMPMPIPEDLRRLLDEETVQR